MGLNFIMYEITKNVIQLLKTKATNLELQFVNFRE